jgi:hypothetical protein
MDANLSFKPAMNVVSFDYSRSAASIAVAAPTELPSEKVVSPAGDSANLRNDPAVPDRPTKGEVVLDPGSRQVIYRVLDEDSRRVVWQMPDAATLRLRAYARADDQMYSQAVPPSTDVEA